VLDVGCGTGELSLGFKEIGCVVVGIDSSPQMIARAKEQGLDARIMDGHEMNFEEEFDAVFSNAAIHWMATDPRLVVQSQRSTSTNFVSCCWKI